MDTSIRLTDSSVNGHIELVPALATLQTAGSLSFSSDLVRLVDARTPLPSRAFSHERGHLPVSGVLLEGPATLRILTAGPKSVRLRDLIIMSFSSW